MKKDKLKRILEYLEYLWYSWYGIILSSLLSVFLAFEQHKHDLYFWKATYYSDMLTAIITFLSIIIGIFGILIPTVISAKEDDKSIANYFFQNADGVFFAKSIRKLISSGILSVICVCLLYLQDILNEKIYVWVFRISVFFTLYFCFGSYRFIGIMLGLLVGSESKKDAKKTVKKYKNRIDEAERNRINEKLKDKNNNIVANKADEFGR